MFLYVVFWSVVCSDTLHVVFWSVVCVLIPCMLCSDQLSYVLIQCSCVLSSSQGRSSRVFVTSPPSSKQQSVLSGGFSTLMGGQEMLMGGQGPTFSGRGAMAVQPVWFTLFVSLITDWVHRSNLLLVILIFASTSPLIYESFFLKIRKSTVCMQFKQQYNIIELTVQYYCA